MNKSATVVDRAIEFILPHLKSKITSQKAKPLVSGVEGPQGSGKTTASTQIREKLSNRYPNITIVQFSIDDFYLTYEEQQRVNEKCADNVLLQGRGLPGTHDVTLLYEIMGKLLSNDAGVYPLYIPVYDKSAYNGKGDRLSKDKWTKIEKAVDLVVFEGWFNGYTSISNNQELISKWHGIKDVHGETFCRIQDSDIISINRNLLGYEKIWKLFDLFVCIKTTNINNVYKWRLEQEHELIKIKGTGMSDIEVGNFVARYMPIYYLYYDRLCIVEKQTESLELLIDESRTLLENAY